MIKGKLVLLLSWVLSGSVLVSCGREPGEAETTEPATAKIEVSAGAETELSMETEGITGIEQEESETAVLAERELTKEELQFFSGYLSRWDNYGFLLSEYGTPAEIDLREVFYSGAGIQTQPMTEQERQAYMKAAGQNEIYTDVVHLSAAQIDDFLMEKIGISNKDMNTPLPWLYVPEYDSYYQEAGDTNYTFFLCLDGSVVNEKYYTLHVQTEYGYAVYQEGVSELVLEKSGDGYRFVSNKVIPAKAAETKADASSQKTWQQEYIRLLQEAPEGGWAGYELIYLNDDDIPELAAIGASEAAGCKIFNYDNGNVYETQLNRLNFTYIEKENLLCNSDGNMDHYYDVVYSIIDGKMTQIAFGYYGAESYPLQFDAEGNIIYQYEWDGNKVTKEEYESALNAVYDASRSEQGYTWGEWKSAEEMIQILEGM